MEEAVRAVRDHADVAVAVDQNECIAVLERAPRARGRRALAATANGSSGIDLTLE